MDNNCLYPNCKTKNPSIRCRGLCNIHYQMAYILVKKGLTTWEDLEKRGKVKPKTKFTQASSARWFMDQ